jgi:hypothetical protein
LRHERATEELRQPAALYALGSLTQQEARSFEIHMKEGCTVCEAEFRKFAQAAAVIGFAAEEAAVPEYMRDLLSARIEREPRVAPTAVQPAKVAEEITMQEFLRPAQVPFSHWTQPKKEKRNLFPWILVAGLVAFGLLAAFAWNSAQEMNTQLQAKVSAVQADTDVLRTKLEGCNKANGNLEQIMKVAGKPAVRIARLVIQAAPPTSSAVVLWDTERNECLVVGSFPPAPEGKNYHLWFFTPAAKVPAGSLKNSVKGQSLVAVPVPQEASGAGAAVITLEPDNGSQIPTSPYYAVGRID